jgi:hypothetical protein
MVERHQATASRFDGRVKKSPGTVADVESELHTIVNGAEPFPGKERGKRAELTKDGAGHGHIVDGPVKGCVICDQRVWLCGT